MSDIPPPPWIDKLEPIWRAWRENEILNGRNPDLYIDKQLIEAGEWKRPTDGSDDA